MLTSLLYNEWKRGSIPHSVKLFRKILYGMRTPLSRWSGRKNTKNPAMPAEASDADTMVRSIIIVDFCHRPCQKRISSLSVSPRLIRQ